MLKPLPDIMLEPLVRAALAEDFGRVGDITSQALIPPDKKLKAALVARQTGILCGLDLARLAFALVDQSLIFTSVLKDGDVIQTGAILATVEGNAQSVLMGERTAINFMSHLCGVATATHRFVDAVGPHQTRICCTRKTTPGLRILEKYAVRAGGGMNHRFGLDDAILIKDNHIAAVGDIHEAVSRARASAGHMVKIQVEVDTLDQLHSILDTGIDAVLLDNMDTETLRAAVAMVDGKFVTEASGGVTLESVAAIAATGVDQISVGWITHSAPILDIGLDAV